MRYNKSRNRKKEIQQNSLTNNELLLPMLLIERLKDIAQTPIFSNLQNDWPKEKNQDKISTLH